jgi:putative phosphoesterase
MVHPVWVSGDNADMRFALISDVHANLVALEAVLADASRAGFDELICLGDVATLGPRPREVLQCLNDIGCTCVLGNHDEYLLRPELGANQPAVIVQSEEATRAELREVDFHFVSTFAPTVDRGALFAFHGTPRTHTENLLATTPAEGVDEMLAERRAPVMAGGHTHIAMLRQHRGILLVNPGSVGMPFREPANGSPPIVLAHAEYAIVDVGPNRTHVDLRRIELARSALRDAVTGWDNPFAAFLRATFSE